MEVGTNNSQSSRIMQPSVGSRVIRQSVATVSYVMSPNMTPMSDARTNAGHRIRQSERGVSEVSWSEAKWKTGLAREVETFMKLNLRSFCHRSFPHSSTIHLILSMNLLSLSAAVECNLCCMVKIGKLSLRLICAESAVYRLHARWHDLWALGHNVDASQSFTTAAE